MPDLSNLTLTRSAWAIVISATVGPFATANADAWNIQWKRKSQSWAEAEAASQYYQVTNTEVMVSAASRDLYTITFCNVLLDIRVQQVGASAYDWHEVAWTDGLSEAGAEITHAALNKRTMTYKAVRDMLIERYFAATPSAAEMARIAQFITSAHRQVMEEWPWSEAKISTTVPVTDGLVTWADLQGADFYQFWTANPWARSTRDTAAPVSVLKVVSAGIYLDHESLTEVFVALQRRSPTFSAIAIVDATDYTIGDVRYDDATGHCYECLSTGALGSAITDGTKWRALPILWLLLEPLLNLAEAQFFSRSQERGQASSLRAAASEQLDAITRRQSQS